MSIRIAITEKNWDTLEQTVKSALSIYNQALPAEPKVETVHGPCSISLLLDDADKWQFVTMAYMDISEAVAKIPESLDTRVETAKLIGANGILRHLTLQSKSADNSLL